MNTFRLLIFCILIPGIAKAQTFEANYDESKVPRYTLPELLQGKNGMKVTSSGDWETFRRDEILSDFASSMYGKVPDAALPWGVEVLAENREVLDGKAVQKRIRLVFGTGNGPFMDLLIYIPKSAASAVPVFLGLNFGGNHTVEEDTAIPITESWLQRPAGEESRGSAARRWPLHKIISAGYGLVTAYYGDLDPDYDDGFKNGVHPLFYLPGQTKPADDEWGAIGAWAWGLSRAMDYFEKDPDIDEGRVAVMGHSRLGKAALWAGALDRRFAIVISNNSGCGGAALSRRAFGETVGRINRVFPHWFCANFKKYNENEAALPVDQHMLMALIAPRPLYIASATDDLWADPKGEFLSGLLANPVYRLYGQQGLPADAMPGPNQPIMGTIGYHLRQGEHDVTGYDWEQYIRFADLHFGKL